MNTITRLGRALYGNYWKCAVADALHVNERTVRRWASGEYSPPAGAIAELRELLVKRADELVEIARD